jgi:peptidyl-prolyl cis-trans isomerase SurA
MKIFLVILLAVATSGPPSNLRAELANGIQAIVHDSIITYQDVQDATAPLLPALRREYRDKPEEFYQKRVADVIKDNLEQLLQRQLVLHDFQTGGYQLPETVLDDLVDQRIRSRFEDRAKLTKSLQAQGMTYEKFRQEIRDQFIIEALQSKNVSSDIIISPHKIEAYYADHQDKFKVDDQIKLRMIVLNQSVGEGPQAPKLAEEILLKIKEGAKFSEMASVYSQGSQRNGEWGWVERPVLRKELADVAFTLKAGETSRVVETPEACYIMQVEEAKPAHVKPLSDAREEIEKALQIQERDRRQKLWLDKLRKKTFIRYF